MRVFAAWTEFCTSSTLAAKHQASSVYQCFSCETQEWNSKTVVCMVNGTSQDSFAKSLFRWFQRSWLLHNFHHRHDHCEPKTACAEQRCCNKDHQVANCIKMSVKAVEGVKETGIKHVRPANKWKDMEGNSCKAW
jgi:hypothetical protein